MTSITVEGRALAKSLKIISMVLERQNTIPILKSVRLTKVGSQVEVRATDLDMEIFHDADLIEWEGMLDICLPGKTLYDISRTAGPGNIKITAGKELDHTIEIDGGEAAFTLHGFPATDWPEMGIPEDFIHMEPFTNGRLAEIVAKVLPAVSTEETRYYLNGIAWQCSLANGRTFTATDGHRLISVAYGKVEDAAYYDAIIPRKLCGIIAKLAKQDATMCVRQQGRLSFRAGRTMIYAKTVDGTYPDWKRVVPAITSASMRLALQAEPFRQALARVCLLHDKHRAVKFFRHDGEVSLTVNNPDIGVGNARVLSSSWPEDAIEHFGMNGYYARLAVDGCKGKFEIVAQSAGTPMLIVREDDGEETTRVIMPMRV